MGVKGFFLGALLGSMAGVAGAQTTGAGKGLEARLSEPVLGTASELPATPVPAKAEAAVAPGKLVLSQSVLVTAFAGLESAQPDDVSSLRVSSEAVKAAAGAYSDIPRFLQTLPGVQFDSDARNTYLVNGGNAMENLYVLDGVEIPSINHISTAGSSGGFVSLIDTDGIASLTLHKQMYGSEYAGTLSSVLEIHTRAPELGVRHGEINLGYAGAGFLVEQPIGAHGTLMTEGRRSVVNYFTDDIGFGGVPKYQNLLSAGTFALGAHDSLKTLFLIADDQLAMTTNVDDWENPGLVNTSYKGSRSTGAVTWHHEATDAGGDVQMNYSQVTTSTLQLNARDGGSPVYSDRLSELPVTLKADGYAGSKLGEVKGGVSLGVHGIDYAIDQANGFPSPYSMDPTPVDASNIHYAGAPMNAAMYVETTVHATSQLDVQAGLRAEGWGINRSSAWMPRVGAKFAVSPHAFLFGGIGSYSQMPALPVMLGVAQNLHLKPIRDVQTQLGATLSDDAGDKLTATAYGRGYSSYPVSTEFPSLSLADVVDPFGLPYLYMPMTSAGTGSVRGAEVSIETSARRRMFWQANVTSMSVRHTALDGVSRRANYDMPMLANVMSGLHIGRAQLLTWRYSYHTGTPYTPFALAQSLAQGREIFDLTQINTQRGGYYGRMDVRYEANWKIGGRNLKVFAGVENVLNKSNFYQYVLLPGDMSYGPYPLTQMSRMPDGGMVWSF